MFEPLQYKPDTSWHKHRQEKRILHLCYCFQQRFFLPSYIFKMASSADVYVFGDQSTPVLDKLQALVRVKDNALLTSFLGEAFLAVRREIVSLSSLERKSIPEAESLSLLLEGVRRSEPHAALDSAFVCIYEIGYYIE